jgi:hypothetical protein
MAKLWVLFGIVYAFPSDAPAADSAILLAASRYAPGFAFQKGSLVKGNFDCSGRKQQAVLGTNESDVTVLVFLNGARNRPEALEVSGRVKNPALTRLSKESLDYDPQAEVGSILPGFVKSKTCTGLNLSDGETDSVHIYWDHESHHLSCWRR